MGGASGAATRPGATPVQAARPFTNALTLAGAEDGGAFSAASARSWMPAASASKNVELAPAPPRAASSTGGMVTLSVTLSASEALPLLQELEGVVAAALLRASAADSSVVVAEVTTPPASVAPVARRRVTESGATPASSAMSARKKDPMDVLLAARGARRRSKEEEPSNDTCRLRATGGGSGAAPGT